MHAPYACEALQEHESETDGHAVSDTLLKQLLELCLLAHLVGTAFLNLSADLAHLVLDVCMRRGKVSDAGQNSLSTVEVISSGQPSWRLGTPGDTKKK
jgi:hypothetical protein